MKSKLGKCVALGGQRAVALFGVEWLEARQLLSWGLYPQMIGLAKAVRDHPTITGAGESVVVMDTGINYLDPLLGGGYGRRYKVDGGYDFVNGTATPTPDPNGHGTGVAGIIAASTFYYGTARYQGVAPGVHLIDVRIDDGSNAGPSDAQITAGLDWVVANQAKYNIVSVNLSEGGDTVYPQKTAAGPEASDLATLAADGVLVACASGNDSTTGGVEYPGADPNAVAVGAVDSGDNIASFTSRGPSLDLLAPGVNDVSTFFTNNRKRTPYIGDFFTGTSFSAPFVAGLAALLKQANPSMTVAQEVSIMQNTGTSVTDSDGSVYKRINVNAAINAAIIADRAGRQAIAASAMAGPACITAPPSAMPVIGVDQTLFSQTPILA